MLRKAAVVCLSAAFLVVGTLLVVSNAPADPPGAPHVPDEVIIKFKDNASNADKDQVRNELGGFKMKGWGRIKAELRKLGSELTVEEAISRYRNHPKVDYIEPNYIVNVVETPNDPLFPQLYGMENTGQTGGTAGADISATNAWDVFKGSSNVIIGVIDTGVDYTHPDLAANIYVNPGEIPGNGIDDDNNGFVDDVRGWDFRNDDNDPMDDHGHGSHVSGTIGGVGNNGIGVAGVCWTVKIMPLKFLSASGGGTTADAVDAVEYATMMGVHLTSNSWGGGGFSQALFDAINAANLAGQLFVAASGNSGANTDNSPHYPSSYNLPNIISVAATDHNDQLASFSNYGATSVDLAAPGVDILSTFPGNSYGSISGTSMATPHVAGALGLVFGRFPAIGHLDAKNLIYNFVDPLPNLAGVVATGGRLNAFFPIADPDSIPPAAVADLAVVSTGSNWIDIAWTAPGDDGNSGTASRYVVKYSTSPIDAANFDAAMTAPNPPDPSAAGSPEAMQIHGLDFSTTYYAAVKALDEFGNAGDVSNSPSGTTLGAPDIDVTPTSLSATLLSGATETQNLTVSNVLQGTLEFEIPVPDLVTIPPVQAAYTEIPKGDPDPRTGDPVIEGTGGPDGFGYRWVDSDEPFGPTFSWTDISGTGTLAMSSGIDVNNGPYPIGFPFSYYGVEYNSFRICSNGFLSFTSTSTAYTNQPLPNAGAPSNMVAPFWDDINLSVSGEVYYESDGSQLIVQWNNAAHYGSGGNYTFQAILSSDGTIKFQYLTMGSPDNSATVGIQNASGTDALQVAFNTNYIHDNLAVLIQAVPQWLTVSPTEGIIYAPNSTVLDVNYNSAGLLGGTYDGNVRIISNDPDEPTVTIPVELTVIGAPDIAVAPASFDFGQTFIGATPTTEILVQNPGTDDLTVSSITFDDGAYTADITSFVLPARQNQPVNVTFAPLGVQTYPATMTILSDDPDEPSITVSLNGEGVVPPDFSVSPLLLESNLLTGETEIQQLTLSNSGGADLEWNASVEVVTTPVLVTLTTPEPVESTVDVDTGSPDPTAGRTTPIQAELADLTGIDIMWDRSHGQTSTFSWTTIISDFESRGATVTVNNDPITPGLLSGYEVLWSVDTPSSGAWDPAELTALADWMVAGGGLLLEGDNSSTVTVFNEILTALGAGIEYSTTSGSSGITPNIYAHPTTENVNGIYLTANVASIPVAASPGGFLFDDDEGLGAGAYSEVGGGRIVCVSDEVFQSSRMDDADNQLFGNQVMDWLAGSGFLTVDPTSGIVPPGGSANIDVTFDATDLFGGLYEANVNIETNDPLAPLVAVPADLQVTGAPDIMVDPASIDFGQVYVGYPGIREFEIFNSGTDLLTITGITSDEPAFSVFLGSGTFPINLSPLASTVIQVRFSPPTPDTFNGTLNVVSNDPDTPNTPVSVSGFGLLPPLASVNPDSLHADLLTNETDVQQFVLSNSGASDLNWEIQLQFVVTEAYSLAGAPLPTAGEDDGGVIAAGFNTDPIQAELADLTGVDIMWDRSHGQTSTSSWTTIVSDFESRGATVTENTDTITPELLQNYDVVWSVDISASSWDAGALTALVDWINAGGGLLFEGDNTTSVARYNELLTALASGIEMSTTSGASGTTTNIYPHSTTTDVTEIYLTANIADIPVVGSPAAPLVDDVDGVTNTAYSLVGAGRVLVTADETFQNSRMGTADNRLFGNQVMDWLSAPSFLTVSPDAGVLPPGASQNVNVTFDAGGLFGGDYNSIVRVISNDPANGELPVDATMHVTGVPRVAWEPEPLDLGVVYLGYPETQTLYVTNTGTDDLVITSMTPGLPDWSVNPAAVNILPLETAEIMVTLDPQAVGDRSTTLTIESNDPDSPHVANLTGTGLVAPVAGVSPNSLHADLLTGEIETQQVTLSNTGGSDLVWDSELLFDPPVLDVFTLATPEPVESTVDVDTGNPDPVYGGSGGVSAELADLTGIEIMWDRSHGQTSTSSWTTIIGDFEARGATVTVNNDPITPALLSAYDIIWTVDTPSSGAWDPAELTALAAWMSAGGGMLFEGDNSSTVTVFNEILTALGAGIEYSTTSASTGVSPNIYPHPTTVGVTGIYLTAAVATIPVREAPGAPLFDDDEGVGAGAYAEIGAGKLIAVCDEIFQNSRMDDADNQLFGNQVMDWLATPAFMTLSPEAGTVPAGGSVQVDVTFDATGLFGGDYSGTVRFLSNDPVNGELEVAATMHVTPVPRVAWEPEPLDLGDVFIGYPETMSLIVKNVGTDHLSISSMTPGLGDWSVDTGVLELDPQEQAEVLVTLDPQAAGDRSTMLTIVSNDPDSPHMASLVGNGLYPPIVATSPDTLEGAALPGGTKIKTLTLCNTGGSDLVWSAGTQAYAASQVFTLATPEPYETTPDVETGSPDPVAGGGGGIQAELADLTGVYIMWDRSHGQGSTSLWTTIIGDFESRGATVTVNNDPITPELLAGFHVLWTVDIPSSGTWDPAELTALVDWMNAGGGLLMEGDNTSSVGHYNDILAALGAGVEFSTTDGSSGTTTNIYEHPTTENVNGIYLTANVASVPIAAAPGGFLFDDDEGVGAGAYSEVGAGRLVAIADEVFQNSRMDDADNQLFGNQVMDWLAGSGWLSVTPETGVLPAGECTDLAVLMDATDLAEGDYTGAVLISSNDPATPVDETPVVFHVGSIDVADFDVDPNTINLGSVGSWINAYVELPPEYDASDVVVETVLLNGTVSADVNKSNIEDFNENGIPDWTFKFDRSEVQGILEEGDSVLVTVTGEIEDTIYFTGMGYVRIINPTLNSPNGGESLLAGSAYEIQWSNPQGWVVNAATIVYSPDGGQTWNLVAEDVTGTSYVWTVPTQATQQGHLRVYVMDSIGILGSDGNDQPFSISTSVTGITPVIPTVYALTQNAPNPFRGATRIAYDLPEDSRVQLKIFDVSGRMVRVLEDGNVPAGRYEVSWDGRDQSGRKLASGIYFYRLEAPKFSATKRMFLLR